MTFDIYLYTSHNINIIISSLKNYINCEVLLMINKLREPINSITHLAGAILSFIALIAMLSKVVLTDPNFTSIISVTILALKIVKHADTFFEKARFERAVHHSCKNGLTTFEGVGELVQCKRA